MTLLKRRTFSRLITISCFFLLVLLATQVGPLDCVWADIRLPKIFSDSMVLQRQAEIPVWGMADPEESLTLAISSATVERIEVKTVCDSDGNFHVKFPSMPVGGPYELEIVGDSSTVLIRDILVGDVWLCSGQSNMEMTVAASADAEKVAAGEPIPNLRLLSIERMASPKPLQEFTGAISWKSATPEHAADFSAVGFYLGQKLQASQQVPIGIINASWGGTLAEAWTSQAALAETESLQGLHEYGQTNADGLQKQDQHSALFNGMIAPLERFSVKGVVWYQGESNVGRGAQYSELLPALIRDWREHFSNDALPFLIVQLAPFRYQDHPPQALAEVWDAQLKTVLKTPGTGLVVTTDLGNAEDIHPKRKRPIAARLSDWAVAEVYNDARLIAYADSAPEVEEKDDTVAAVESETESTASSTGLGNAPVQDSGKASDEPPAYQQPYASPLYRSYQVVGSAIHISFYAGEGLKSRDGEPLREFQIAGQDQEFHPAQARIEGDLVIVESEQVTAPQAVRFAFRDTPDANLVNRRGLPASPFRTDSYPLLSSGRDY